MRAVGDRSGSPVERNENEELLGFYFHSNFTGYGWNEAEEEEFCQKLLWLIQNGHPTPL